MSIKAFHKLVDSYVRGCNSKPWPATKAGIHHTNTLHNMMGACRNDADLFRRHYEACTDIRNKPAATLTARQERINEIKRRWSGTVWFICFSRDCDLMEHTWAKQFKSLYEADLYENDLYDNAEGATSFNQCDEEDYLKYQPRLFDRAAWQEGY